MMLSSSSATTPKDPLKKQTIRNHPFNHHRFRVVGEMANNVVHDSVTTSNTSNSTAAITLMNIPRRKKTLTLQQQQSTNTAVSTSSVEKNKSSVADRLLKRRLSLERQQQHARCSDSTIHAASSTSDYKLETTMGGSSSHTVETTEETDVSSFVLLFHGDDCENANAKPPKLPKHPNPPPMVVVRTTTNPSPEEHYSTTTTTTDSIGPEESRNIQKYNGQSRKTKKRRLWKKIKHHKISSSSNNNQDYADGDDDLSASTVNLFETTNDSNNDEQKKRSTQLQTPTPNIPIDVGTRVEIYWDGEKKYFAGTVTKRREKNNKNSKPFYVVYDDGDKEWVDFSKEKNFRILPDNPPKNDENDKPPKQKKTRNKNSTTAVIESVKSTSISTDSNLKQISTITTNASEQIEADSTIDTKDGVCLSNPSRPPCDYAEIDWVSAGGIRKDSDDSDTDEEEIMNWACKMFGVAKIAKPKPVEEKPCEELLRKLLPPKAKCDLYKEELEWLNLPMSISEKVKLGRRRASENVSYAPYPGKKKNPSFPLHRAMDDNSTKNIISEENYGNLSIQDEDMEMKRRKEEARPLTAAEIAAILAEDDCQEAVSSWVRRSVRQPSKSALNAPKVKELIEKLRSNDSDMVVLKMKKYCSDLDTPQIVIDAVLDALEENTNCEALYIQNFNEGVRDEQVMHLLRILQKPSCNIWCLNIGETYNVQTDTWEKFTEGLKHTKVTHMYASEHTISTELKDKMREYVRDNRSKHNMHIDPNNLDTIVRCTHNWWNPINAKVLRPYLRKRGYEYLLKDADAQGLKGTSSGANLAD